MSTKGLAKNWKKFLKEQEQLVEYSITFRLRINRRETRAVIDDTLARIRAIPNITVVNSNTREEISSPTHASVDIEFKFIPVRDEFQHIKKQLRQIKNEMKTKPYVDGVIIKYNTIKKIE